MTQGLINVRGTLETQGDGACNTGCGTVSDRNVQHLSIGGCIGQGESFQSVVGTKSPIHIATSGAVGDAYVDLDVLDQLVAIEFLHAVTSSQMKLLIGAAAAIVTGSGGTFPTTFGGGETLIQTIDGVQFTTTFDDADESAAQAAARINAAAALAGLATPRASVTSAGQLQISGITSGSAGAVSVDGGTGAATLGLTGSAAGSGEVIDVQGLFMNRFPRYPSAPTRIQVSGQGTIKITAGGRSSV